MKIDFAQKIKRGFTKKQKKSGDTPGMFAGGHTLTAGGGGGRYSWAELGVEVCSRHVISNNNLN
jgi:hypothetical protein